jgi:glycosyltransferase involved in cell wall biosynthesis
VEGFTDIRFVTGLSEICDLTLVVPARQYRESDLKGRVARSGCRLTVAEVSGGRLAFQFHSLRFLLKQGHSFDVILAQEMLRGAFNANLAGRLLAIPVVTYLGISPIEYFRCRYERRQIGILKALVGEMALRCILAINGRLCRRCLAMGPYLERVAARYCSRSCLGLYYGVDVRSFRPASPVERAQLRHKLTLPADKFIVLLSSRMSHEKDPETVLEAVARARSQGLDAIVLNLGGGHREFLAVARRMGLEETDDWVLARPAVHPMIDVFDYFRAADVLAQASLAEGAAFSTLEALACALPVIATAVGGMGVQLPGVARLVPRCDAHAMAQQILWVAAHPEEAAAQALRGREFVAREWNRDKAFAELLNTLEEVSVRAGAL